MLNYVWISLLLVGIFTAAGKDSYDEFNNTYRNGVPFNAHCRIEKQQTGLYPSFTVSIRIPSDEFNRFYNNTSASKQIIQSASITTLSSGKQVIEIPITEKTPSFWVEMAKAAGGKEKLEGRVTFFDADKGTIEFTLEQIHFVKIRAITKSAIEYADTAVTISLGLIGVMALWLGIMKVGEAAGLLTVLTRLLTPLTKRLFPDIPPNHPAIGSMIMNISANMLGLSNAATPLGLKAMEELNKINPKIGTASNAMCTFLVINTSGLTLIPATAIAIRAGLGSSDPGIIIGTTMFGAACATIAGLIAVKFLERFPRYKKQLLVDEQERKNG
jgi:spore maturation protein A